MRVVNVDIDPRWLGFDFSSSRARWRWSGSLTLSIEATMAVISGTTHPIGPSPPFGLAAFGVISGKTANADVDMTEFFMLNIPICRIGFDAFMVFAAPLTGVHFLCRR